MKKKKIVIILSHSFSDMNTAGNKDIADRIRRVILKYSDPKNEKIESVTVEDYGD